MQPTRHLLDIVQTAIAEVAAIPLNNLEVEWPKSSLQKNRTVTQREIINKTGR